MLKPYGESLSGFQAHLQSAFLDAKKSVWVPDGEGGFDEAMIDTIEGEKVDLRTFVKLVKLTFFL